jgi:hypothetical protein
MSRSEFEAVSGMTDTNPYGNDGFFSRVFGIDPSKIDYTSNLGPRGIENVKRQAYDRFMNPFARVDAFGRPTMGADPVAGTTRSGVQPGDLTIYGPAVESRPQPLEGIASIFNDTPIGRLANPPRTRITGYDTNVLLPDLMAGPPVGGGTEPPDVPYFPSSTNPPLVPDAPFMEDIKAAREVGERSLNVDTQPQEASITPGFIRPDDAVMPTVADIIAATPMVIQEIPGGDPGSASITVNPQTQTPTYVAPDQPVDLLSDILAPDGSILPGVVDAISSGEPQPQVDPRTGRMPGTPGTFDFGGGTSANVTSFTPQDIARMNKRAQDIDALRFQYIQQGMPPALAFARARAQVGQ